MFAPDSSLERLLLAHMSKRDAREILSTIVISPGLLSHDARVVPRLLVAMALNAVLMHRLLQRVPSGDAYVREQRAKGQRILVDHGAVRTVLMPEGPTGAIPGGDSAFSRILEPLGYARNGFYPLQRLRMIGRSFTHLDAPDDTPQFFVSELHVAEFSAPFQAAARRVFGPTTDPLDRYARTLLSALSQAGSADINLVDAGLRGLIAAFDRRHPMPSLEDYLILKRESAEAAWIATEGNAFNHVTDRVEDIEAVAKAQRAKGRPIKDLIEVSESGRIRQTAFRADPVSRSFVAGGELKVMEVPGSFYEFISRGRKRDGKLDLGFDSGNAQGIFKMTDADTLP